MRSKEILIELINKLDEFENENSQNEFLSFDDFISFLNSKNTKNNIDQRKIGGEIQYDEIDKNDSPAAEIARLVGLMYRYAKHYLKKALTNTRIQTPEEFSFLITLMTFESLTKTELINKNIMEKTSGAEIIKRLLKSNFIIQFADLNDKRSQRVSITPLGISAIFEILPKMASVSEIVVGNLTETELNTLSYLLKKLDNFHHNLYENQKSSEFSDILHAKQNLT